MRPSRTVSAPGSRRSSARLAAAEVLEARLGGAQHLGGAGERDRRRAGEPCAGSASPHVGLGVEHRHAQPAASAPPSSACG